MKFANYDGAQAITFFIKIIFFIFLHILLIQSNVSAFTFKQSSADIQSTSNEIRGINFKPDGTKMYITEAENDKILQYSLSTAYDLTTMSLDAATSISDVGLAHGIEFNLDGTKMFIIDNHGDEVEEYTLSTAWDTTDITRMDIGDISNGEPRAIDFNSDGTKFFVINQNSGKVQSYTLTTAFDVSSNGGVQNTSLALTSYESKSRGLQFNSDGTVLYIAGSNGDEINKLTLSTAYDISSSSLDNTQSATTYDVSAQSENLRGFVFIDNSSVTSLGHAAKFFITDDISSGANTVKHYFINADPTLSSCSPADGATGVGLNDNIALTFSEIVDVESGNVVIKKSSDDSVFESIDITGSKVSGTGTTVITINPAETFVIDTDYYITIDATAFDDVDSASYAGINDSTTCNFTTGQTNPLLDDKDLIGSIEGQVEMSHRVIRQTTTTVMHRIEWLRRHKDRENLTNQNINFQFSDTMFSSILKAISISNKKESMDKNLSNNWFLWSEGDISIGKSGIKQGLSSSAKKADTNGITIGADNRLNSNKMYGLALRFGEDDIEVGSSGTTIDTDAYSLSLYGTLSSKDNNFLDGILGMSTLKSDHIRKKNSDTLTGKRDGKQIFSSINLSKLFYKDDFNFNPTARIDFGYTELGGYSERGKNALIYDKHEILTGTTSIGMLFDNINQFKKGIILKKIGRLEYSADFSPSSNAKLSYLSDPATDYNLTVGNEASHNLRAGLGFDLSTDNGFSVIANYERFQKKDSGHTDTMYFTAGWISNKKTQYALTLNGMDNISTEFSVSKNMNNYNLKFNINSDLLNKNENQIATLFINKIF